MVVTGGSRGIGAAAARLGAEHQYAVCVNYRERADRAAEVVDAIMEGGGTAIAVQADVALEADVERLFQACDAELGPVTVLVNNAGIMGAVTPIAELALDDLERMFAVNVTGATLCSRAAIRRMSTESGGTGGVIVNVSSIAARLGNRAGHVAYGATKAALDALTVGLAHEVGPLGIRVNAVRPGLIDTEIQGGHWERFEAIAKTVPLGARAASPDEVARAILWLASDAASYVTGAILDVTGGR